MSLEFFVENDNEEKNNRITSTRTTSHAEAKTPIRIHPFSTYAKFCEKLTFFTP